MPEPPNQLEEPLQSEWIYLGQRDFDRNGTLAHIWRDHTGKERAFTKALVKYPRPGAVYRVFYWEPEDGRVSVIYKPSSRQPLFLHWAEEEVRLRAQAESSAAQASAKAMRLVKESKLEELLEERLEPIRNLMRDTNATGRRAILILVTDILTS